MLHVNITIKNPFIKKENFRAIVSKSGNISRNKAWEIESFQDSSTLLKFELTLDWRGRDHAGPSLGLGLFGYEAEFKVYDIRHWDYDKNKWEDPTPV